MYYSLWIFVFQTYQRERKIENRKWEKGHTGVILWLYFGHTIVKQLSYNG